MLRAFYRVRRVCLYAFVVWASLLAGDQTAANAEMGRYPVDYFGMRDYRAHNQVWRGVEDSEGILYFANRGVVLEFDGETWRHIQVPDGLFVRGLAVDKDDRIWVGAEGEIGFLDVNASGDRVYTSLVDRLPASERDFAIVWEAHVAHDGVYFVATHTIYRWANEQFTVRHRDSPRSLLCRLIEGRLHVFERGEGLWRIDGDEWTLISDDPFFKKTGIAYADRMADGSLLLGTAADGLFVFKDSQVSPLVTDADDWVRSTDLYDGARLADGSFALAGLLGGMAVLRPDGSLETVLDLETGLTDQSGKHILEARDGTIWLSTNNGVEHVQRGPITLYDKLLGLPHTTIEDVVRHNGRLYVATNLGLFVMGQDAGSGTPTGRFERVEAANSRIMAIQSHPSGLLVTLRRRVFLLNDDGFNPITPDLTTIHALGPDQLVPGRYFAGHNSGITPFRFVNDAWVAEETLPGVVANIRTMVRTPEGILWLGTPGSGLFRIRFEPEDLESLANPIVEQFEGGSGLPDDPGWTSAHLTDEGEVFFRTSEGLFTFDESAERFERFYRFGRRFGDGSHMVSRMEWDRSGRLWASVEDLEQSGETPWGKGVVGFATPDGKGDFRWQTLPPNLFSPIANIQVIRVEQSSEGNVVWIGADRGLIRIDLDRFVKPEPDLTVRIRNVATTDGRHIWGGHEVEGWSDPGVPYAEHSLRFEYAAPSHGIGRSILYQTRLDGFDPDWSAPSSETYRVYTNLVEGDYAFRVRAVDGWSTGTESPVFAFKVMAPWYRTIPAYLGYLLLAGFGVFGIVRWRVAVLRRENERLEEVVDERTAQLRANEVQLKQAKKEAEQANEAKSVFLANMSHELRTPLNGILGYAQIMQNDANLDARNRDRVRVLRGSGDHLLKLINEVLDLSKVEAGRIELNEQVFNLKGMIDRVIHLFRPRLDDKGLGFEVVEDDSIDRDVVGDEQKIGQVLFNLLGNAVKFTDEGRVVLAVSSVGERVRFEVKDTGVGISPERQTEVFQPFQQVVESARQHEGTGLGLTISHGMVALMGGTLRLESEPGRGSRFWFEIPLPDSTGLMDHRTEQIGPVSGYEGPRKSILVVDDDRTNRDVLVQHLTPLGFDLQETESGDKALEILKAGAPDLTFLDLRMHPTDGFTVLERLRHELAPQSPMPCLVAYSASAFDFTRGDAIRAGFTDILTKPYSEEELYSVLERHLGLHWTRDPIPSQGDAEPASGLVDLGALLELARRGDARALRLKLVETGADQPGADPLLAELFGLARNYEMEKIRSRLRAVMEDEGETI